MYSPQHRVQVAAAPGQQQHTTRGEQRPQPVEQAPGTAERHRERAEELDGHRDTERDLAQCHVETEVHDAEDDAVGGHDRPCPPAHPYRRPPHDQQHERGEEQPQRHGAGTPDRAEQLLGERGTHLDAEDAGQHLRGRRHRAQRATGQRDQAEPRQPTGLGSFDMHRDHAPHTP
jgi:hypothetical protein